MKTLDWERSRKLGKNSGKLWNEKLEKLEGGFGKLRLGKTLEHLNFEIFEVELGGALGKKIWKTYGNISKLCKILDKTWCKLWKIKLKTCFTIVEYSVKKTREKVVFLWLRIDF